MVEYELIGTEKAGEVIAVEDGRKVGSLSFEVYDDVCIISFIYVDASVRRRGIGTMLMLKMYNALFLDDETEEVSVILPHEDEALEAFLGKMAFERDHSFADCYSFILSDVLESPLIKRIEDLPREKALPIKEIRSPGVISSLKEALEQSGFECDIRRLYSEFDSECSMVFLKDGRVCGFTIINPVIENKVMISFMYIEPEYRGYVAGLIKSTALAIEKKYTRDCSVSALIAGDEGLSLITKLVGDERLEKKEVIKYYTLISSK
ncbi:MAG: GNAT family N-acetyltransferase [Lachnospiraceae bacterium]|nr:GNAT family N-acetyltransferase [Lachnospiraceae bacterium]